MVDNQPFLILGGELGNSTATCREMEAVMLSKSEPGTALEIGKCKFICKNDYTLSWTPGAKNKYLVFRYGNNYPNG